MCVENLKLNKNGCVNQPSYFFKIYTDFDTP